MKINEELLEIYKTLLKELAGRDVSDEEVTTYVEVKLLADLVMTLDYENIPETFKQLKVFAAKELKRQATELETPEPENELTEDEES